ncbi:xanthine dehydrogenase family protein subunit M [Ramlibacter sp. AW1]|uniref:Xanthine dehydrogenase family protein subunit M n=1 Tax=Ramlibacter aurantiacus TaxID=2801330 RepID=A0A936ZKW9_9BURK|nr:xanthine dehydrogenase family protein subunit M [Ramlibacter aurantiacus]MBL0419178.1 xanthine dehydrogenase family protein subunit M [Ramlibacter aurantiacus]
MRDFEFLQPTSVAEASRMLADHGDEARLMAGGTALMLVMRQRMLTPTHIVSAARLPQLRGIEFDAQRGLRIGALERHCDIAHSPLVRQHVPMLAAMAAQVANPQVRNQGTLGGNLCYGDPSTDPPGCLLALGAEVRLASSRGERVLPLEDFLVDFFVTALEPDEVVVDVRVPPLRAGERGAYTRFRRTAAEHRPLASVSLVARVEGAVCQEARLVVGASVPVPRRLPRAEHFLRGKTVTPEVTAEAADIVAADIAALDDSRGSEAYRRDMVRVVTRRTLANLFGIAGDAQQGGELK